MQDKQKVILKNARVGLIIIILASIISLVMFIYAIIVHKEIYLESSEPVTCISVIGHRDESTFIFETKNGKMYTSFSTLDNIFVEGKEYNINNYSNDTSEVEYKHIKMSVDLIK